MHDSKEKWKLYAGAVFFAMALLADLSFVVVPFLGFSGARIISLLTVFAVLGEVFFLISVLFVGKAVVLKVKEKIAQWFKRPVSDVPVIISRKRHMIGVWLFFISFIPYPLIEISLFFGYPVSGEHTAFLIMLIAGDILYVVSLFVLGEPFWNRLKQLFRYSQPSSSYGSSTGSHS